MRQDGAYEHSCIETGAEKQFRVKQCALGAESKDIYGGKLCQCRFRAAVAPCSYTCKTWWIVMVIGHTQPPNHERIRRPICPVPSPNGLRHWETRENMKSNLEARRFVPKALL